MEHAPTVVGINRTQDASVAVASGGQVYSLQKERISRRKHHWGRLGDVTDRYLPRLPQLADPVDLVVECFSSDEQADHRDAYREELEQALTLRPGAELITVSHHLAHVYSAFPPSPFDRAAVLVIDAQGSRVRDFTEALTLPPGVPGDWLEVNSVYRCDGTEVECLGKQVWDGDWDNPVGLGCFYALLTRMLFPHGDGNEGKVMGLAPFGDPDALEVPELQVRANEVLIPAEWLKVFADPGPYSYFQDSAGSFGACADLAAAGQRAFERALLQVARWLRRETGCEALCFAGGTALNCSANAVLLADSGFKEMFIPPSPHDGGTAVGCALYGLLAVLGQPSTFRWTNDFLGPAPDPQEIAASVAGLSRQDFSVEQPADLAAAMVDLLAAGQVVALHEGRSESGPRALGHRSILADAREPGMQDYINFQVKGREGFRPLAPLVLATDAERIFQVDRPAPFMQYAAAVRPEYRAALPAITHVDGTARLQTVEPVNTPFLHELLTAFAARTGTPVLLNTSLNGPGDPLTETPADSLATFARTGMHALAMPPFLIRKRVEPSAGGEPVEHRAGDLADR